MELENALLFLRSADRIGPLGRDLEHPRMLSRAKRSQHDDFAVRKLQSVVMNVRPVHIHLPELRHLPSRFPPPEPAQEGKIV